MDKIIKYRKIVRDFMQEIADMHANQEGVETEFLIDKTERHFQLVNVGFLRRVRVYGTFIHIDLADDGKVWIQQDGSDLVVAQELEDRGIPKEDIVLGFHEPSVRKYTGYAVA
ncbi:MAG TPA: XisI protein [Bacteroidetes bacterium]|nr:XisI protein [Bacteroidota bacterium]